MIPGAGSIELLTGTCGYSLSCFGKKKGKQQVFYPVIPEVVGGSFRDDSFATSTGVGNIRGLQYHLF